MRRVSPRTARWNTVEYASFEIHSDLQTCFSDVRCKFMHPQIVNVTVLCGFTAMDARHVGPTHESSSGPRTFLNDG